MNSTMLKKDFPIFHAAVDQIYLDNAATTHKPRSVIDAVSQFYGRDYATVHRALYPTGERATEQYEQARDTVAAFINAANRTEVIFTKGTTEGINFIAQTWALAHLQPGDEIVLTQAEHHSNLLPWQRIAHQTGAKLVFIPIDPTTHTLRTPLAYLSAKTKLVAVTADSNVLGPVWNHDTELKDFIAQAHALGAVALVDAAQMMLHKKLDVQALGADFVLFSGHKMLGPTGIGVVYINQKHHATLEPYHLGGSMVHEVTFDHARWLQAPHKFEAGTPPIAGALGLAAAVDYINKNINFAQLAAHEAALCAQIIAGVAHNPAITVVGNKERLMREGHVVSLAFNGVHPHDIATHLGFQNIAVRAGHFCAQPLITSLGYESLLRISVAPYNTARDIEMFVLALNDCLKVFAPLDTFFEAKNTRGERSKSPFVVSVSSDPELVEGKSRDVSNHEPS